MGCAGDFAIKSSEATELLLLGLGWSGFTGAARCEGDDATFGAGCGDFFGDFGASACEGDAADAADLAFVGTGEAGREDEDEEVAVVALVKGGTMVSLVIETLVDAGEVAEEGKVPGDVDFCWVGACGVGGSNSSSVLPFRPPRVTESEAGITDWWFVRPATSRGGFELLVTITGLVSGREDARVVRV